MKYHVFGMIAYVVFLAACSTIHPTEPEPHLVEERYLILPSEELAKKSGSSLKDLHVGFGIWMRECGKCHEPIFPDEVSSEEWHKITPKMAWNSNISDGEEAALLKYILAAKSEPSKPSRKFKTMKDLDL